MNHRLEDPWLVAAWPGMGSIARLAGAFLAEQLGAEPVAEIPPESWYEPQGIRVKDGLVQDEDLPKSMLLGWKDPTGGRDLVIFLAEAQPNNDRFCVAEDVLDRSQKLGVKRVYTFAAMASTIDARSESRVLAVATNESLVGELLLTEATLTAIEDETDKREPGPPRFE